jgi:hypothetical protein
VTIVGVAYAGVYTRADYGPIVPGVGEADAVALFDHVREITAPEDVFVFQKPRALALFTGRRASGYEKEADDETLWEYFHAIGADYLIVAREFDDDRATLGPWVQRNAGRVEPVHQNAGFSIYRIAGAR